MAEVKIARTAFICELNGSRISVRKGALVRDGHALLKGRENLFRSVEDCIDFDVEKPKKAAAKKTEAPTFEVIEPTPEPDPED